MRHGAAPTSVCTKALQFVIDQTESPLSRLRHFSLHSFSANIISQEAEASEHHRRLHIRGVVEWKAERRPNEGIPNNRRSRKGRQGAISALVSVFALRRNRSGPEDH